MKLPKKNLLKDALHNTSPDSGATCNYAAGVVVGVVSTLMAGGTTFDNAVQLVKKNLPKDYRPAAIPESWRELFEEKE